MITVHKLLILLNAFPMALGPFRRRTPVRLSSFWHGLRWRCPLCCLPRCTCCLPRNCRFTQLHLRLLEARPGRRRSGASRLSHSELRLVFELTLEVVMGFAPLRIHLRLVAPLRIHLRLDSRVIPSFGTAGSLAEQVLQSGRTQECEIAFDASGRP